jgi:hypothetical protein
MGEWLAEVWRSREILYIPGVARPKRALTQIGLFATPAIHPVGFLPHRYPGWLPLNPMAAVIERLRGWLLGVGPVDWGLIPRGNLSRAAMLLGVTRPTLCDLLGKQSIDVGQFGRCSRRSTAPCPNPSRPLPAHAAAPS